MDKDFKFSVTKDKYEASNSKNIKLGGMFNDAIKRVADGLFMRLDNDALVSWFRYRSDPFAAGEFFGKILRAEANFAAYTGDEALKAKTDDLVRKILLTRDPDGCISTVPRDSQPNGSNGSDLWERKYVLLGLFEYYDNFGPTLDEQDDVYDALVSLAVYTASQIGVGPGKTRITDTGWAFCGIESSSILEPIMKLYLVSGSEKLLEFAKYIVESGACSRENIFEAAISGKSPYKIGSNGNPKESIAKAYEMMSCFEGLLEYYRATGDENALKATVTFIQKVNNEEITYLGSGGADGPFNLGPGKGEQWNRTFYEQTNPGIELAMETCVTVTYMKLLFKAYLITGDVSLIDRIEVSAYNALLGALSPDGSYFEYFPKFNGTRRVFDNFSYQVGDMRLSCCTANGPMGLAVLPKLAVTKSASSEDSYFLNIFAPMTYSDGVAEFTVKTLYPLNGTVKVTVTNAPPAGIKLFFRVPKFKTKLLCSEKVKNADNYAEIEKRLFKGDEAQFTVAYRPVAHQSPVSVNPLAKESTLYTYGPVVLSVDKSVETKKYDEVRGGPVEEYEVRPAEKNVSENNFTVVINGVRFVPYFAAGRSFDENTEFKSWIEN